MSIADRIKRARGEREALLVIAEGLDDLYQRLGEMAQSTNTWDSDESWVEPGYDEEQVREAMVKLEKDEKGNVEVELPPADEATMAYRRKFEQDFLHLEDYYGEGADARSYVESYVKGGPLVLYFTDRDFIMSLPYETRQKLVEDVLRTSPKDAANMGADVLKHRGAERPTLGGDGG